jgi:hypothetical protein
MAVRDLPITAAAMGINVSLYKTLTFGVSTLYTGVAGALGPIVIQFVGPNSFPFLLSVSFPVALVVGRRIFPGKSGRRGFRAFGPERCRAGVEGPFGHDLRRHFATADFHDAVRDGRLCSARRRAPSAAPEILVSALRGRK